MREQELTVYRVDLDQRGTLGYDSIRELIFFHYNGRLFSDDGHAPFFIQTMETIDEIRRKISLESPAQYDLVPSLSIIVFKFNGQESKLSVAAQSWLVSRFRARDLLFCFMRAS